MELVIKNGKCLGKWLLSILLATIPLWMVMFIKEQDRYHEAYTGWAAGGRYAHISVLFPESAGFKEKDILQQRSLLASKLKQDNVYENKTGNITVVDGYSTKGTLTIETGIKSTELTAYGVGGHFFQFHPFRLLSGAYFSEENENDDLMIIDEDLAWQLFGSSDVTGMSVTANGRMFRIYGVISRESGLFNKAAGNGKPAVYVSFGALAKCVENDDAGQMSIMDYEVIMPELTDGYAQKNMKENLRDWKDRYELVQVSGRFSYQNLLREITKIGKNVMAVKAIEYPFWENKQRACVQLCAVLFLMCLTAVSVVCLLMMIAAIRYGRRNKSWLLLKIKSVKEWIVCRIKKVKEKQKKQKVNTVILDIGMVLVEFKPEAYLKSIGIRKDKCKVVLEAVVENEIWDEYDRGVMTEQETLEKMIKRRPALEREIRKAFENLQGIIRRYDYTDSLIKNLKEQGYRVLYLSNLSEKLRHECEEELAFVNEMDGGIFSFEAKMKKPDREIYEELIGRYSLQPEQCVFFDDREVNLRTAEELGFKTELFEGFQSIQKWLQQGNNT